MSKVSLNMIYVTSVVVALGVMLTTFWTMLSSFKYLFGLLLFLLTFLICRLLLSERSNHHVKITLNLPYATKPFVFSISLLSILIVFLVPSFDGAQYVAWDKIPLPSFFRLISALFLTSFYPGYTILAIVAKKEKFSSLEKITLSISLSLFISGLIGFISTMSEGLVGNQGFLGLMLLNILLLILFTVSGRDNQKKITEISDFSSLLILATLILFALTASYVVNFPEKFVPTLDQWKSYGVVLEASSGTLFSMSGVYPYWFHTYASLFILVSGFPSANAYLSLLLLQVLPVLSFYLLSSSLFSNTKMSTVATVIYALFGGFGGLYVIHLILTAGGDLLQLVSYASSKTFDMAYLPSLRFFISPKIIGFSTLFLFFHLLKRRFRNQYVKISLMATLFGLGYLAHIVEGLFFILIIPLIVLFLKSHLPNPKELPMSVALALLLVSLIDLVAPQKVYIFRHASYTNLFLSGLSALMFLSFVLLNVNLKRKILPKIWGETRFFKRISPLLVAGVIYIYLLSFIIWSSRLSSLSLGWEAPIPWYVYPMILGVACLFTIASIPWLVYQKNSLRLRLPLLLVILFLLLGKSSSYLKILSGVSWLLIPIPLYEIRMTEFTCIGLSLCASFSIVKLFQRMYHMKAFHPQAMKSFFTTFMLSFILITGTLPHLYAIELRSQPANAISVGELDYINVLRSYTQNVTVLAPSSSTYKLDSFGGMATVHKYYRSALFGATKIETLFDLLSNNIYQTYGLPIRYLVVSNDDLNEIRDYENSLLFNHLTQYLPILLTNEEITVYEVPSFTPPSPLSRLTILVPLSPTETTYLFPLEALSLTHSSYTVSLDFDPKLFTYPNILLSCDPEETNLNDYLQWISKGNSLIVLNSLGTHSSFATLLSLNTTETEETYEVNGIQGPKGEITVPLTNTPIFVSRDESVKPLSFYTKDEEVVSPYAFHKRVGAGELVYIEVNPYFTALQQMKGCDAGRNMFAKLGDLLNILGLPQLQPLDLSKPIGRATLYGQTDLTGKVVLRPSSFYIPTMDSKFASTIGWRKDNFSEGWSVTKDTPDNGTMYVNANENVTRVTFNATSTDVWQYFRVNVPNVDASKYRYLILREKIEINSYHLGHLRVVINGNMYQVRGWISETWVTGHPWKIYVFDLHEAVPSKEDGPTPPKGSITQILWTGCSRGTEGGLGELYLNFVTLCSSPIYVSDIGKCIASLGVSHVNECIIDDDSVDAPPMLKHVKVLDFQLEGGFEIMLTGSEVQLTPTGLGVYSKGTFSRGLNCTIWLSNDAVAQFSLMDEHKVFDLTARGGHFNMSISSTNKELVVYMANVHIINTGLASFEKAFISGPYKVFCLDFPLKVNGQVSFDVNAVDRNFALISNIDVNGTYTASILSESKQPNEWDIPWVSVFVSPYHILLVACISIGLMAYYWRKREQNRGNFVPHLED